MKNLPKQIPVFPLSGVIYFPKTNLPLNIFEQRYLNLVNDTIKKDKLIGMIQSRNKGNNLYKIGCLGKISEFQESDDGRILINLTGITRFEIIEEKKNSKSYREFIVDYKKFLSDLEPVKVEIAILSLIKKAEIFFNKNGLLLNWKEFNKLEETQKINTLSMIAPITNEEKQKLLESISLKEKVKHLGEIIDFYLHSRDFKNQTIQ